jgi:hypothetical protein
MRFTHILVAATLAVIILGCGTHTVVAPDPCEGASSKRRLTAIEVKSGPDPVYHSGTGAVAKQFAPSRTLLVGGDGIPVETFLTKPIEHWVG